MEIVRNNIIPFKGYKAVNLFGILFVRGDAVMASVDINHESIHTAQMKEMLYVFFYLWYVIEWLVRLVQYRNAHTAYRNIGFEREAYMNQGNMGYLQGRGRYAWVKYLKK
ncbi:hypothetical protein [uncultured Phocaeicola sp.]|uniref:hypothetical protein n=1 Tax=uncultured Phocaeicola sp. TaxID=990718 RepID=UPI0025F98BD8|nr:hypothetical protein [uncultured Phocaeicola sp.]